MDYMIITSSKTEAACLFHYLSTQLGKMGYNFRHISSRLLIDFMGTHNTIRLTSESDVEKITGFRGQVVPWSKVWDFLEKNGGTNNV